LDLSKDTKLYTRLRSSKSIQLGSTSESQVSDKDKTRLGYKAASPAVEGFVNSSEMLENQENVESRLDKGYHEVPPPFTRNYMPLKRDLRLIEEHFERVSGVFSTEESKPVMKNGFSPLIIEDWHSNDESEVEISSTVEVKIVKPSVDKIKFVKTARETVKNEEYPKQHKHHPRGNQKN
nr:hypothetical protein [Tanacetum cinerariifolium]